ncbi:hypothetical protein HNP55_004493 [Paucibacter oligotrophus]|uniref:Cysteine-rich CWC n=1 Tax=Roseateles oligotrophus TaxID=1769250 RepID=A0A840LIY3_9BURK|nr:cysteine-rich CWC family protein [Roseateles oligotrophus]MBB4845939.1 hypothetical protein [Roseateles oligotrophus]
MSPAPAPRLDERCPRCGGGFHCGAQDQRCDCFDMKLSEDLRQRLGQQYSGCLCLACLRTLSAEDQPAVKPDL